MDDPIKSGPGATVGWRDTIVADLPVGVMQVDDRGTITYANACALALFAPLQPEGMSPRALLNLAGVRNGSAVCDAIESGRSNRATRLDFANGKIAESHSIRFAGSMGLVVCDVTHYAGRSAVVGALDASASTVSRHVMTTAIAAAAEAGVTSGLICISLDRFNTVNQSLGRAVGDELVHKILDRIRGATRKSDQIAWLGANEFAVLQIGLDQPAAAQGLAVRLLDLVGRTYVVKGHVLNVDVNIGVAINAAAEFDADTLFRQADFACHRARSDGRGQMRCFEPTMDSSSGDLRSLETELRKALALNQFELAYQPQYDATTREVSGFEALLRWRHPVRGLISPAQFIPLAEETGMITTIGEWVLRTALLAAASWARPVSIGVNVSPVQFRDGRLLSVVQAAIEAAGIAPERVDLEITEGALLEDSGAVLQTLQALKTLGVRISMDDFGTGYSSLSYLQKFPFDKIKIDQSFVRGGDNSAQSRAIVNAIAALGISMGLKTVAEGVETDEQLERVRASGCNEIQGYLTGRPVGAEAAAALVMGQPSDEITGAQP